jgi:alkylation response protein AidB-like acyl-CoA dehydrogenase
MDFDFTEVQRSWREKAQTLGRELAEGAAASDVIMGAARVGLIDATADLVAASLAVEALACESAAAGMTLALHTTTLQAFPHDERFTALARGEIVGAIALTSEDVPSIDNGKLGGRPRGSVHHRPWHCIVGARNGSQMTACRCCSRQSRCPAERGAHVGTERLRVGVRDVCGDAVLGINGDDAHHGAGENADRIVALGIGNRALRESLSVATREHGAGGEQTVQGLLADTATDLEAARMLTWQAAAHGANVPLAAASMAEAGRDDGRAGGGRACNASGWRG